MPNVCEEANLVYWKRHNARVIQKAELEPDLEVTTRPDNLTLPGRWKLWSTNTMKIW